jgi:hypothetical protein
VKVIQQRLAIEQDWYTPQTVVGVKMRDKITARGLRNQNDVSRETSQPSEGYRYEKQIAQPVAPDYC